MVQRLEDRIHTAKTKQAPVIDLEKNDHLKGLEHNDAIYQTIIKKRPVQLSYQSFKAREAQTFTFHPYLLKEYRNRWFVMGIKKRNQPVLVLALDRILEVEESHEPFLENTTLNLAEYFKHVIGVSVNPNDGPEEVELYINRENAPYVLTKPLHHSQQLVERTNNGIIVRLQVQLNFELEREILGFGDCIKVLKPHRLKRRIQEKMCNAAEQYEKELNLTELAHSMTKVKRRGYAVLENIYTSKEVGKMLSTIVRATENETRFRRTDDLFAIRGLLKEIPNLKQHLFNENLCRIIHDGFGEGYFLTKAIYFDKPPKSNWYVTWHQDVPINVTEKIDQEGFSGWTNKAGLVSVRPPVEYLQSAFTLRIHLDDTDEQNGALKVIPRTHFSILSDAEIAEFRDSTESKCCKMRRGGVHLLKPLTMHASSKTQNEKHRRVIHLEFNNQELPGELEWLEREEVSS